MVTIEERAKQAVQANYDCKGEYPCSKYKDCVFGCGTNTAYDCEECGADEFEVGYLKGSTEQRKIDIEKACDFMRNFTLPNGAAPLYDYTGNLRKAMEE